MNIDCKSSLLDLKPQTRIPRSYKSNPRMFRWLKRDAPKTDRPPVWHTRNYKGQRLLIKMLWRRNQKVMSTYCLIRHSLVQRQIMTWSFLLVNTLLNIHEPRYFCMDLPIEKVSIQLKSTAVITANKIAERRVSANRNALKRRGAMTDYDENNYWQLILSNRWHAWKIVWYTSKWLSIGMKPISSEAA